MALSITNRRRGTFGNQRTLTATVTFDSSYATGGEDLTASTLGFRSVHFFAAQPTGGRVFPYTASTGKLQAYASTTEVANATDLSAVTTQIFVIGT